MVLEAITQAGYKPGDQIGIALDPASSEFYQDGMYVFKKSDKSRRTSEQMVEYWANWRRQYPIISIEDGMAEDDWDGWKLMTDTMGTNTQLVGDDLFVTNTARLQHGHRHGAWRNSILVKVNQIGTLTETLDAMQTGVQERLYGSGFASFGRDGRSVHCRSRGGDERRTDQDRIGQPHGPDCEVQPAASD